MTPTRNLIVTGAAGGMGSSVLELLKERDVNVVCVDRDASAVEAVISRIGPTKGDFVPVGADVSEAEDVSGYVNLAVERWGGLDGLFNIAGVEGALQPFLEATIEDYDRVMKVNARSVFLGIKFSLSHLIERGGGSIVSTGSYLAIRGEPSCGVYGASKHAIVGMTQTLAVEVAQQNVRANVVCPGSMDTRMIKELYPRISEDLHEAEAVILQKIPQGRMARPDELASTGVWLLLDAPEHLTGQVLMVDGGRSAA
jgi:NAD(P)-dependent dehydrogenase (short-subunit alcohol dehydrogenase family)